MYELETDFVTIFGLRVIRLRKVQGNRCVE